MQSSVARIPLLGTSTPQDDLKSANIPAGTCTGRTVVSFDVEMPPKRAYQSAYALKATLTVHLADGNLYHLKLPASFARKLKPDCFELPSAAEEYFRTLFDLEQASCTRELMAILERRDHSRSEAHDKLKRKGYLDVYVDSSLSWAEERSFLNDSRFARYFIEEKKRAGWGRRRIELELASRGVEASLVPGYPDDFFNDEDDLERAESLLARKRVPDKNAYEKLVRFLVGKGFDYRLSREAVRRRLTALR